MKIDLKKQIAAYTAPRGRFEVVTVPAMQFLMVDGRGDPNTSQAYQDAVTTIFPVAYALKFLSKNELGRDHTVMPLEGLWWAEDMAAFTSARDKTRWSWTLMIMVPDWIGREHFDAARQSVARKRSAQALKARALKAPALESPALESPAPDAPMLESPALDALRLESFDEGLCVQTLHVGSYDDEAPVLAALHEEFLPAHGLRMTGKHHEVYLGDPRRAVPDKLRTILRQPVTRVD